MMLECRNCYSFNSIEIGADPPHYKKLICGDCGCFIQWLPKPENIERSLRLLDQLKEIQGSVSLSRWQSEFVNSLIERCEARLVDGKAFSISPKQMDKIEEIFVQNKFAQKQTD